MPRLVSAGLWLALAVWVMAAPAGAVERIVSFDSRIEVKGDASLVVTETIKVIAERRRIRRGIYRDFPIRTFDKAGFQHSVGFKILRVERDGKQENYRRERIGDFARIYIGRANVFLRPGEYTYTIRYRTTRQLRHFKTIDELYWNVTGNQWAFPIDKASATVVLPAAARIVAEAAYTGRYGSTAREYLAERDGDNIVRFTTTRPLGYREGLTVAVGFNKGVVAEPSQLSVWLWWLWDNAGYLVLFAAGLAVSAYYVLAWLKIGRDPEKGLVIPLYSPPDGLSPAVVSFIHYQGFAGAGRGASKALIAALVSLASKGLIKIDNSSGRVKLVRLGHKEINLPSGEATLLDGLLGMRGEITFNKTHGKKIQSVHEKFKKAIRSERGDVYFKTNLVPVVIAIVASVIAAVVFMFLQHPNEDSAGNYIMTLVLGVLGSGLTAFGGRRLLGWLPGGGSRVIGIIAFVPGVVLLAAGMLLAVSFSRPVETLSAFVIGGLGVMAVTFFYLMRAPTEHGRKIMDRIEGFKHYLSVAEAERLNLADAPDMSSELFERFLPYAIALGVEKPWSDAFAAHLARTAQGEDASSYQPTWYSGSNWSSGSLSRATRSMVAGISSSYSAAMPAPSSSSGSGGGGFSGGGGGGGGGGGW